MFDRITPMEIEKQEFRRALRGFDAEDVRLFLKSIAEQIQRLNLENDDLRDKAGRLQHDVEEYRSREKTLQETLLSAQRMSDDLKERSRAEARLVVREARGKAEVLLQQSQDQLTRLEDEIGRSKLQRNAFDNNLRGLIRQHTDLLEMRCKDQDPGHLRLLRPATGSDAG